VLWYFSRSEALMGLETISIIFGDQIFVGVFRIDFNELEDGWLGK